MIKRVRLLLLSLLLIGCSPAVLEGEVVSSNEAGQGLKEYLVRTNDEIRPNVLANCLHILWLSLDC